MFCPNCGKDCGNGKFCAECGQRIDLSDNIEATGMMKPPIGRYEGVDGYIDLSFYTLTIHKKILSQTMESVLSLGDVKDVVFCQATDYESGYLAIRGKTDFLPMPETEWDAVVDEAALTFDKETNNIFYTLYRFLNQQKNAVQEWDEKQKETKTYCPKCKSINVRTKERYTIVPVTTRMADDCRCLVCGYRWTK